MDGAARIMAHAVAVPRAAVVPQPGTIAFLKRQAAAAGIDVSGGIHGATKNEEPKPVPAGYLDYPRDFFPRGKLPNNSIEAAKQRKWRMTRKQHQAIDDPADGAAMMREMRDIRLDLRQVTAAAFNDAVVHNAEHYGLHIRETNQPPRNREDVRKAISTLDNNQHNHILLWLVLYAHFGYGWTSKVIDGWMTDRKMFLLDWEKKASSDNNEDSSKTEGRKNHYCNERGGFSLVVVNAKQQATRFFTDTIHNTQGWKVGVKGPPEGKEFHNSCKYTRLNFEGLGYKGVRRGRGDLTIWLIEKVIRSFYFPISIVLLIGCG